MIYGVVSTSYFESSQAWNSESAELALTLNRTVKYRSRVKRNIINWLSPNIQGISRNLQYTDF